MTLRFDLLSRRCYSPGRDWEVSFVGITRMSDGMVSSSPTQDVDNSRLSWGSVTWFVAEVRHFPLGNCSLQRCIGRWNGIHYTSRCFLGLNARAARHLSVDIETSATSHNVGLMIIATKVY